MISPLNLMERLGVAGRLVPFLKAVCVYFAVWTATGAGAEGEAPSLAAVAAKCAPVVCLAFIVLAHRATLPTNTQQNIEARRYSLLIAVGLLVSAGGDALLAWPARLVGGMALFAAAHCCYIAAFGWRPLAPLITVPLLTAAGWYLWLVRPPRELALLVPLYTLLLAGMAWRAAARGCPYATAGAALFLASDAALGYTLFAAPLRHGQVIVMSTYYLAQLGIAMSALHAGAGRDVTTPSPSPRPRPAPAM